MANLDMEVEAPGVRELISVDARRETKRQRYAENAPAPNHEPQPRALDDERHRDVERAEALAQQALEAAAPFLLHACERAARKVAQPMLAAGFEMKRDLDRHIVAGGRKSDD